MVTPRMVWPYLGSGVWQVHQPVVAHQRSATTSEPRLVSYGCGTLVVAYLRSRNHQVVWTSPCESAERRDSVPSGRNAFTPLETGIATLLREGNLVSQVWGGVGVHCHRPTTQADDRIPTLTKKHAADWGIWVNPDSPKPSF